MNTKIEYNGTKLPTSNFIFFCLKKFQADFDIVEYDLVLDNLQIYNGILVSKYIPLNNIEQLKSIPNITIIEAMEGASSLRPTYLLIQLNSDIESEIQKFINILNENITIKSNYEYDQETKLHRIGITSDLYLMDNPLKFKEWWADLPNIVINAVEKLNFQR